MPDNSIFTSDQAAFDDAARRAKEGGSHWYLAPEFTDIPYVESLRYAQQLSSQRSLQMPPLVSTSTHAKKIPNDLYSGPNQEADSDLDDSVSDNSDMDNFEYDDFQLNGPQHLECKKKVCRLMEHIVVAAQRQAEASRRQHRRWEDTIRENKTRIEKKIQESVEKNAKSKALKIVKPVPCGFPTHPEVRSRARKSTSKQHRVEETRAPKPDDFDNAQAVEAWLGDMPTNILPTAPSTLNKAAMRRWQLKSPFSNYFSRVLPPDSPVLNKPSLKQTDEAKTKEKKRQLAEIRAELKLAEVKKVKVMAVEEKTETRKVKTTVVVKKAEMKEEKVKEQNSEAESTKRVDSFEPLEGVPAQRNRTPSKWAREAEAEAETEMQARPKRACRR